MARPQTITLKASQVNKILKLADGNKKNPGIGARQIHEQTGFARRQVMAVLEENGRADYAEGSYA